MKAFAKKINRLPVWLFAVAWGFFYFIANTFDPVSNLVAPLQAEECFIESTSPTDYPIAIASFDSPQIYVQGRNAEDKGKHTSKYSPADTFTCFSAASGVITHFFHFLYSHFFKYLFILYCVLLI